MKMRELNLKLNEKLIGSGNWAPHPFIENGLVEIHRIEKLLDWGFELGHEPNDVFCLWYSSSENEKATGESGFEFGGVEL
jgi:hypothetical protein